MYQKCPSFTWNYPRKFTPYGQGDSGQCGIPYDHGRDKHLVLQADIISYQPHKLKYRPGKGKI